MDRLAAAREVVEGALSDFAALVSRAAAQLEGEQASQLLQASTRTERAIRDLKAFLTQPTEERSEPLEGDNEAPAMRRDVAALLLRDLDALIHLTERSILQPIEGDLAEGQRREFRRRIGQLWGWIVCDLQDPLWRQYPEFSPSNRA